MLFRCRAASGAQRWRDGPGRSQRAPPNCLRSLTKLGAVISSDTPGRRRSARRATAIRALSAAPEERGSPSPDYGRRTCEWGRSFNEPPRRPTSARSISVASYRRRAARSQRRSVGIGERARGGPSTAVLLFPRSKPGEPLRGRWLRACPSASITRGRGRRSTDNRASARAHPRVAELLDPATESSTVSPRPLASVLRRRTAIPGPSRASHQLLAIAGGDRTAPRARPPRATFSLGTGSRDASSSCATCLISFCSFVQRSKSMSVPPF